MFTADMPGHPPVSVPSVFYPATDCVVGTQQETIERDLIELPDRVADALGKWRFKTAEKKREYARLFLTFKANNAEREITNTELKAMVANDPGYYQICLDEIMEESRYVRLYERLMCAKRSAQMRTAF